MDLYQIIKNEKKYWLVDQKKIEAASLEAYRNRLDEILQAWRLQRCAFLSLLMDEAHESWLIEKGFPKVSAIGEYTRTLTKLPEPDGRLVPHSLAAGNISDAEYGALYDYCRSGSANKNETQPIAEVLDALKGELAPKWREHCYYFTVEGDIVGISIPHIEPGTDDEGRLFYFGVMPEARGQGIGAKIHQHSLKLLKQLPASYYVGSTDINNIHMIRIFEKNACKQRAQKGIYRLEADKKGC